MKTSPSSQGNISFRIGASTVTAPTHIIAAATPFGVQQQDASPGGVVAEQ
jgi:hypothetical protein